MLRVSYLSHACHTLQEPGCKSPALQPEEQTLLVPHPQCCAEVPTGWCSLAARWANRLARLGQTDKRSSCPVHADPREGAEGWDVLRGTAVPGTARVPAAAERVRKVSSGHIHCKH